MYFILYSVVLILFLLCYCLSTMQNHLHVHVCTCILQCLCSVWQVKLQLQLEKHLHDTSITGASSMQLFTRNVCRYPDILNVVSLCSDREHGQSIFMVQHMMCPGKLILALRIIKFTYFIHFISLCFLYLCCTTCLSFSGDRHYHSKPHFGVIFNIFCYMYLIKCRKG